MANAVFLFFDALKAPVMNQTWLEDFLTLAATGNFSRAAEKRHMTQPAFSRRVKALEEWIGVDLFDRSTQPAQLTPAGVWFKDVAQDMMAQFVRLPGEARAVAEEGATMLRFASTHALSFTFLPDWLRGLEPKIGVAPIQLVSDVMSRCEALLLQSKVQFMLSHEHPLALSPLAEAGYPSLRVGSDTLIPVAATDADGVPLHLLPVNTATGCPLLAYSEESGLGKIVRVVKGRELDASLVHPVFTAHLATVLRTMAVNGRGVAWLPATLIADDLALGRLAPAGDTSWHIDVEIRLYRNRIALGNAAELFWSASMESLA